MFGANLVILTQICNELSRGQAKFLQILSQNGKKNDLVGQGQWHPFSIPIKSIPGRIFGANLVIPAQTCDELSCRQGKVYGRTDRRKDRRTDTGNDNTLSAWKAKGWKTITLNQHCVLQGRTKGKGCPWLPGNPYHPFTLCGNIKFHTNFARFCVFLLLFLFLFFTQYRALEQSCLSRQCVLTTSSNIFHVIMWHILYTHDLRVRFGHSLLNRDIFAFANVSVCYVKSHSQISRVSLTT